MIKNLVVILALSFVAFSCSKVKFKEAEWMITDPYTDPLVDDESIDTIANFAENIWDNKRIVKISSAEQLQAFAAYEPARLIDGELLLNSKLASVDFSASTVFVFGVTYESQCERKDCGKMKHDKIKIEEDAEHITFDFKFRTRVGGSGMIRLRKYFFLVIPNEEADHTISGKVTINERGDGLFADDIELSYQQ